MSCIDTVTGLELFCVKGVYGVYLKCDRCGDVLDAPRKNVGQENERISASENDLVSLARRIGWTGDLSRSSSNDLCPKCSGVERKK